MIKFSTYQWVREQKKALLQEAKQSKGEKK
jgi:hypothetical protein